MQPSQSNHVSTKLLELEDVFKKLREISQQCSWSRELCRNYKSKYWMGNSPICSPLNIQQRCSLFDTVFSKNDSEMKKPLVTKQLMQCRFSMPPNKWDMEVGFSIHRSYNHRMSDLEIMLENNQSILQMTDVKSRKTVSCPSLGIHSSFIK